MQYQLKPVDRFEPSRVLDVPEWLTDIPRNDDTIREFFSVMRSGHSRLKEDADGRRSIDQSARAFRQRFESADGNAFFRAARVIGLSPFSRVPRLMDPVVPTKNEFHFLLENGKAN